MVEFHRITFEHFKLSNPKCGIPAPLATPDKSAKIIVFKQVFLQTPLTSFPCFPSLSKQQAPYFLLLLWFSRIFHVQRTLCNEVLVYLERIWSWFANFYVNHFMFVLYSRLSLELGQMWLSLLCTINLLYKWKTSCFLYTICSFKLKLNEA